jgi:hypothetical protein
MALSLRIILAVIMLVASFAALADDERAQFNYTLHCQGCHLPEAEGFAGKVPVIKDFAGYFLHSQTGREFLIRVPGVALSALDHSEPFTAAEVQILRRDPERDPATTREIILAELAAELPGLASELTIDH